MVQGRRAIAQSASDAGAQRQESHGQSDPGEWMIGHSIEQVTPEEVQRRYDALTKGEVR